MDIEALGAHLRKRIEELARLREKSRHPASLIKESLIEEQEVTVEAAAEENLNDSDYNYRIRLVYREKTGYTVNVFMKPTLYRNAHFRYSDQIETGIGKLKQHYELALPDVKDGDMPG